MIQRHLVSCLFLILVTSCNVSSFRKSVPDGTQTERGIGAGDSDNQLPSSDDAVSGEPGSQDETGKRNPAQSGDSTVFSFLASQELNDQFSFSMDDLKLSTKFILKSNYSHKEISTQQVSRPLLTDMATQGNPGKPKQEKFLQEEAQGLLDLLVVIDDSGSMLEEQQNLGSKLNELLVAVKNTDWRIGVVTTSPKDECKISIISSSESDAAEKFKKAINAGTTGDGNEAGIKEAVNGLRCTEMPWLRNDSTVAVLIVSDEDNCSTEGKGCRGQPWEKETYLIEYVENTLHRKIGETAGFYGIFSDPSKPCSTAFNDGIQYKKLVTYMSSGQKNYGDICDNSYKQTLNKISANIAGILKTQWQLKATPSKSSVKVSVEYNGIVTDVPSDHYTLSGRTITFNDGYEPNKNSTIIVDYKTGAKPMLKSFNLTAVPAENTLVVKINGVETKKYTLNGQSVVFDQEPEASASISFDYRDDKVKLIDSFELMDDPKADSIEVRINEVKTPNFSYDAQNKRVNFLKVPTDGASIRIAFLNRDGPVLNYTLPIDLDSSPRDFKLSYNEQPVVFTLDESVVTIDANDHVEGRELLLQYEVDDTETKTFTLPNLPKEGSVEVVSTDSQCSLGNGIDVVDEVVTATCTVRQKTDLTVKYQYVSLRRKFVANVRNPELGRWRVYINGIQTEEYTRSGTEVTLTGELPQGAKVSIYFDFAN